MPSIRSPRRFRRAGVAYVRFAVENPAHFRVLNLPSVASQESLRVNVQEWIDLAQRVTNVMGVGLLPRPEAEPGRPKIKLTKKR